MQWARVKLIIWTVGDGFIYYSCMYVGESKLDVNMEITVTNETVNINCCGIGSFLQSILKGKKSMGNNTSIYICKNITAKTAKKNKREHTYFTTSRYTEKETFFNKLPINKLNWCQNLSCEMLGSTITFNRTLMFSFKVMNV